MARGPLPFASRLRFDLSHALWQDWRAMRARVIHTVAPRARHDRDGALCCHAPQVPAVLNGKELRWPVMSNE